MKAEEVLEVIGELAAFIPIIKDTVPLILEAGSELLPVVHFLSDAIVDSNLRSIERYRAAGISKKDSILLVLNSKIALAEALSAKTK